MARNSRKAAPAARRAAPRVVRRVARDVGNIGARKVARASAPKPLIAVDIGNSETTVGRFLGPELETLWRLSTNRATADELKLVLEGLLKTSASGWGAAMCTVVPALTRQWTEALRAITGRAPLSISAATVPVSVRVPDPASVGADRLANAHAARRLYGAPAIVVDLGTATNFDCVAPDGAYVGGAIAPGMVTASEDLFRRAARLARVDLRRPKHAIGKTTEECLRVGVLWGNAGMVDAIVRRLRAELGGRPKVIATGGLAHVLAPECETVDLVDEGLTLKGMRLLWEETT